MKREKLLSLIDCANATIFKVKKETVNEGVKTIDHLELKEIARNFILVCEDILGVCKDSQGYSLEDLVSFINALNFYTGEIKDNMRDLTNKVLLSAIINNK